VILFGNCTEVAGKLSLCLYLCAVSSAQHLQLIGDPDENRVDNHDALLIEAQLESGSSHDEAGRRQANNRKAALGSVARRCWEGETEKEKEVSMRILAVMGLKENKIK
jgi:hypothetical protein